MVTNGWRQGRVLKQDVEGDRNFLLFASLTLGAVVIVFALWYATP